MFFSQKRSRARGYTRYGRSPVLTSKSSTSRSRRGAAIISNISMPSLTTIKGVLLGLTVCVIAGAGLYLFAFSSYFKIADIRIEYEELQNENDELLGYFESLKGKNILLTDTDAIVDQIRKDHPELQQITARKNLPSSIQIHFSEFPIIANIEQVINGEESVKMLVNSMGMPVYSNTENPNLPYIKIISKRPTPEVALETAAEEPIAEEPTTAAPTTGTDTAAAATIATIAPAETAPTSPPLLDTTKPILSAEALTYILEATSYFEEKFGMKILETQFMIEARELHVRTEKYFNIWLDTQVSYEHQFLKLKKAMATLDIYTVPLDYIDLRITGTSGEKVIFKRKK